MDPSTSLPFESKPHDAMRQGLASLKEDVAAKHPVELLQEHSRPGAQANKLQMLRDMYGIALPARMQIEQQILERFQRLPGLPSSKLGLEALTGTLDEFSFESYIGLPELSEEAPADMHSQMEQQLGMGSGTKPVARGIL